MPLKNFGSEHFSEAEKEQAFDLFAQLQAILRPKLLQLSKKDRQRYGNVGEDIKLFINKVYDFYQIQPQIACPEVDWVEFAADYENRHFLEIMLLKIASLQYEVENTKMLHDFDNYQDAIADYAYTRYRIRQKLPSTSQKYEELKQFFAKKKRAKKTDTPKGSE